MSAAGLCYGRTDLPLADPGAAGSLAAQVRHFDGTLWTSPLQRCRAIARAAGPHHVDARLQELDFGTWEGLQWDAVPRVALDAWAADPWHVAPPAGETGAALVARVEAFFRDLPSGRHVIVSHGGPLKVLAALAAGTDVDLLAPAQPLGSVLSIGG